MKTDNKLKVPSLQDQDGSNFLLVGKVCMHNAHADLVRRFEGCEIEYTDGVPSSFSNTEGTASLPVGSVRWDRGPNENSLLIGAKGTGKVARQGDIMDGVFGLRVDSVKTAKWLREQLDEYISGEFVIEE